LDGLKVLDDGGFNMILREIGLNVRIGLPRLVKQILNELLLLSV